MLEETTTKKNQAAKVTIINLDEFKTNQLPELQNKKASLKKAIAEFPFTEIVDNATYELQKKSRTGIKTIRTDLEKEKKMVVGKIKENILNAVSNEYDNLISIDVKPFEDKYQAEVDRWETIKENERLEKIRIEDERKAGHKKTISDFENEWSGEIQNLVFENIEATQEVFNDQVEKIDFASLQEYEIDFKTTVAFLRTKLEDKIKTLTDLENIRLEQNRLAEEQAKIKAAKEESDRKEAELEKQRLADAEKLRIEQENFLKEKIAFRTEKRIKQLTDLGLVETDEKDFAYNALTLVSNETITTSNDAEWDDTINLLIEATKQIEVIPEAIENTSDVEQINVIDEENVLEEEDGLILSFDLPKEIRFDTFKMTYEEKVFAINQWVAKCEEHELDNIINQYLN